MLSKLTGVPIIVIARTTHRGKYKIVHDGLHSSWTDTQSHSYYDREIRPNAVILINSGVGIHGHYSPLVPVA